MFIVLNEVMASGVYTYGNIKLQTLNICSLLDVHYSLIKH